MKYLLDHISSLVLISGMSGAGKSTVLHAFSDEGFYVIDNLPVPLFSQFIDFSKNSAEKFSRTALLLDIDSRERRKELLSLLECYRGTDNKVELVFLECRTETILKRYSETRRPHPGFEPERDKTLADTIERERNRLSPIKEKASFRIDTSLMNVHDLRREIKTFVDNLSEKKGKKIRVNFFSFGFKYGMPFDCDLVVDVRFLPNPYFVEELRQGTGLDQQVADYVYQTEGAQDFLERYKDLLEFLVPHYVFEGKSYLNVGIGCTGGRHRSVAIAEALAGSLRLKECLISVRHRDIEK